MAIAASDTERERLIRLAKAQRALRVMEERELYEGSLYEFVRASWSSIDSSQFQDSWAMGALCEHLEAVTRGQIRRLLINYPPRGGKSTVASICWPAWVWAQSERTYLSGPNVKFLFGSYGQSLSLTHSIATRRLISSPFYQRYWGERFVLAGDQNAKTRFDNSAGGSRIATSVGGQLVGLGGDVLAVDDPANTEGAESDAERDTTSRWWRELSTTRMNDPRQSAIVVIMQRMHENDVSGLILDSNEDWDHLMLPMRYDWPRHSMTSIGWNDPRGCLEDGTPLVTCDETGSRVAASPSAERILNRERQGALLWPERFGEKQVKAIEDGLGPYMASGRLQQSPEPPGGGIFKREWWEPLPITPSGKPTFKANYPVVASLDSAYTAKDENDPSALTVWASFKDPESGKDKLGLIHGWAKRLELLGPEAPRLLNETEEEHKRRTSQHWGLVEWVIYSCRRFKVDKLVIENKASGHSVAQAIKQLAKFEKFDVVMFDPGDRDKVARAYSVQHLFSQGLVCAPPYSWAETIKTEMALFPKAEHDDLCFVGDTLIATKRGNVAIKDVRVGDLILTPIGWKRAVVAGFTGVRPVVVRNKLVGTYNHPVYTFDKGYVNLDTIGPNSPIARVSICSLIKTIRLIRSNSKASPIGAWAEGASTTSASPHQTLGADKPKGYTSRFGSTAPVRQSLRVSTSIMSTATVLTAALKIWSAYRLASITAFLRLLIGRLLSKIWTAFARLLLHGMGQRMAWSGTSRTLTIPFSSRAQQSLTQRPECRHASAVGVEMSFDPTTSNANFAHLAANRRNLITRQESPEQSPIITVQPVFNLTVEDAHCYYANGVLVHNCDSVVQALIWLRENGAAIHKQERAFMEREEARFKRQSGALYDV